MNKINDDNVKQINEDELKKQKRREYSRNYYATHKREPKPKLTEEEKKLRRQLYQQKYRNKDNVIKPKLTEEEKKQRRKEQLRKCNERYREKNREKINSKRKEYIEKNRESIKQYNKEYQKKYRDKNKKVLNEYKKTYNKTYYEKNKLNRCENKAFKSTNYIYDTELLFEIIISLGLGKLTDKCQSMLFLIVDKVILKFNYNSKELNDDCKQEAKINILLNWKNFDPDKYNSALPYFTELTKRSIAKTYNLLTNKSKYHKGLISLTSFI